MNKQIKIVDFYKNQDIFITGGLGFMGKVLIEKLLRSCSDLKRIFVLIRETNNKTATERLHDMIKSPLFDILKSENPLIFKKLIPIKGDVCLEGLGISEDKKYLMRNVTIVFHSAATIRFKDPFSQSILINTNGTYEVMKYAENFQNIKAVVHLSTIFCNLDQNVLEEKVYPPYADWKEMIELAKNSNNTILEDFVKKHISVNHNNYTLSKHLAEQVVESFKDKLPIVIFRPSVVINTIAEPIPGWTDTLTGPLALAVGTGTGLIRIIYGDVNGNSELVAVDVAIKAIIVAAYKKGIEQKSNELNVYNCSITFHVRHFINLGLKLIDENPFEKCIWYRSRSSTNYKFYFLLNFILFQILPAIFIDILLFLTGQRPFLLRMQKKIYSGIMAYRPFASGIFDFKCENTLHLDRFILPSEFDKFAFMHYHRANYNEYLRESIKGLKLYFLKDPAESTRGARIRSNILFILDKIVKFTFYGLIIRWILKSNFIQNII